MYQRWVVAVIALVFVTTVVPPCARTAAQSAKASGSERDRRIAAIHERFVFADIHAHPSAFHRANVDRIDSAELARYRRGQIDLVVTNISSDAAYQGGYTKRDGTSVERLR